LGPGSQLVRQHLSRLAVILAERRLTEKYPYTQTDLGKETGLNKNTISSLFNNTTTRFDACVLDALCRVLDVGVSDLLEYVPDEESSD
jgi:putative transcriptional regulator